MNYKYWHQLHGLHAKVLTGNTLLEDLGMRRMPVIPYKTRCCGLSVTFVLALEFAFNTTFATLLDASSDDNKPAADRTKLGTVRTNLCGAGSGCFQPAQQQSMAARSDRCRYEQ